MVRVIETMETKTFFSLLTSIAVAILLQTHTGAADEMLANSLEESTSSVGYSAEYSVNSENSWKELRPDIQKGLSWLLRATADWETKNNGAFLNWYFRYYCHSKDPRHASLKSCAAKAPSLNSVYSEFRYNQMSLEGRVGSACVFSQIEQELNPRELDVIHANLSLNYADQTGSIGFNLVNGRSSFAELVNMFEGAPYSTAYCAGSKQHWYCKELGEKRTWGIRSTRLCK